MLQDFLFYFFILSCFIYRQIFDTQVPVRTDRRDGMEEGRKEKCFFGLLYSFHVFCLALYIDGKVKGTGCNTGEDTDYDKRGE